MTLATQVARLSDVLLWEEDRDFSRQAVTLLDTSVVEVGTVLGKITVGDATPAAFAGNAANTGTIASVAVAAGAVAGVHKVVIIEPATGAGKFVVEGPDGVLIGTGTVAAEFVGGGLTFTVTDGSTDFIAGEGFTITVAAGSGKYVPCDPDAADGSQVAAAISLVNATASGDIQIAALVRHALVKDAGLKWADQDAGEKTAAKAALAALGIHVRESV